MTDFGAKIAGCKLSVFCLYFVGISATLGFAPAAEANSFQQSWHAFKERCLFPYEDFKPPLVEDLVPVAGRDGAYQLPGGAVLIVGGADDLGSRSCAVEGAGLVKGYKEWTARALQSGVYRETETPGLWMSHEWAEPRIIVEKTPGKIRVVESELEA